MTSIEKIIDDFISKHNLDTTQVKEPIIDLVNKCIEGMFRHIFQEPIPAAPAKSNKVLKADKIEDPSTVEKHDDLFNCTTGVLNQFCKENNIKQGGNKTVMVDRVWRFLQGEMSDEDKSGRSNSSKAANKTAEKHQCCGQNAKGQPCGVAGTEHRSDMWFCWRHIVEADEIIAKNQPEKPKKIKKESKKKVQQVQELVSDTE